MNITQVIRNALGGHVSQLTLDATLRRHLAGFDGTVASVPEDDRIRLARNLEDAMGLFSTTPRDRLRTLLRTTLELEEQDVESKRCIEVPIHKEVDVNVARNQARLLATQAGVSATKAIKLATSVSELARNIILYAGSGKLEMEKSLDESEVVIRVRASDDGPGIDPEKLEQILSGRYRSKSGLGKGLLAVKRIADRFDIDSRKGKGTHITLEFWGVL